MGTPVLAGNLEYLSSVVNKFHLGLCADARNPKDIAAKLRMMIHDADMRFRFRQNGLKAVRDYFNWGVSEQALFGIYASLTPSPPPRENLEGQDQARPGSHPD